MLYGTRFAESPVERFEKALQLPTYAYSLYLSFFFFIPFFSFSLYLSYVQQYYNYSTCPITLLVPRFLILFKKIDI